MLFIGFFACSITQSLPFPRIDFNVTGKWSWEGATSSFYLELRQAGDSIKGHYCAIGQNGNRIDCSVDETDSCELIGRFSKTTAQIQFKSCYVGDSGKATITYDPKHDKLSWVLSPSDGDFYAPDSVVLSRDKTGR